MLSATAALGWLNARAGRGRVSGEERAPPPGPPASACSKPITWVDTTCHASRPHSEHRDINKEPAMLQQGIFLALLQYFTISVLINSITFICPWNIVTFFRANVEGYGCRWMIWFNEMLSSLSVHMNAERGGGWQWIILSWGERNASKWINTEKLSSEVPVQTFSMFHKQELTVSPRDKTLSTTCTASVQNRRGSLCQMLQGRASTSLPEQSTPFFLKPRLYKPIIRQGCRKVHTERHLPPLCSTPPSRCSLPVPSIPQ